MNYDIENTRRYNAFVAELLNYYADLRKGGNVIFSPVSILLMLAIASDATTGNTSSEITRYLNWENRAPEFKDWLLELEKSLSRCGTFTAANAVCVHKKAANSIKRDFPELLRIFYSGELFSSSDMVSAVNKWVAEKTRGMIDHIADNSMRNMIFCLMNAVTFEDKWLEEYKDSCVSEGIFSNADGSESKVSMLNSNEEFYIENDSFTGFTRDYRSGKFCFMALLPKRNGDGGDLADVLGDADITGLYKKRTMQYIVHVSVPEFEASFEDNIAGFCKQSGINEIFTDFADFSPLSTERLKADAVIHSAKIEVNRQGTKAAAATIMAYVEGARPNFKEEKIVNLDRPFVYAVVHNETGIPVFAGIFNQAGGQESPGKRKPFRIKSLFRKD